MKKYIIGLLLLTTTSIFASETRCSGGNYVVNISSRPTLSIELQDLDSIDPNKKFSGKNINVKRGFVTKYELTSRYGSYYEIILNDLSSDSTLSGFIIKIDGRKKRKTSVTCY